MYYSFPLRILNVINKRIDEFLDSQKKKGYRNSKNQFISEAILEKLEREEKKHE